VTSRPADATVLIPTYNRARLLDETLDSLRGLRVRAGRSWNAIVVDNNSTDETRAIVERQARDFPVPLRYLFEARQGRSSALNAGLAAADGAIVAMTDDDVRVDEGWLDAACDALLESPDPSIAYAGGPVSPIWEVEPPPWLDLTRGDLWGTIAIQDHGQQPFVYDDRRKVPLGANMAARRSLFERIGMFRADLGRSSGTLVMGQEVPELLVRARAAGLRGVYVPAMHVRHHIPAKRLDRAYFRRWWYGKGVSRAMLEAAQPITEMGIDLRQTPHVLGVPRYMYGCAVRDLAGWLRHTLGGRATDAFRHAMMLAYFRGYFRTRRRSTPPDLPAATSVHR
jgi:glycosyltransferase involved in cell wall biosynthesis